MKHIKVQTILSVIAVASILIITTSGVTALTPPDGGSTTTTNATTPTSHVSDVCHPENDIPPGVPLSAKELQSCKACKKGNPQGCLRNNKLIKDLQIIVDVMSAGVGVVVVAMIIIGGIQYSIAGDNPEKVKAARQRITNALIALVAFMFIFAFVQWLIPGGVFS